MIETAPFGVVTQPAFLNQVIAGEWHGTVWELLSAAQATERSVGRTATYRWGPREIDVDVLLFGDLILEAEGLSVPHPGLTERTFVLEPLVELDPTLVVPGTGRTVAAHLDSIMKM